LDVVFDQCGVLVWAAMGRDLEKLRMLENEEPCLLFRRAGFSKIDDLW